jgi:rubrerythrin
MNNQVTNILKQAIIMENRGKSLYEMVASQTQSEEVRNIFKTMAEEEQMHIDFLSKQFAYYQKYQAFDQNQLIVAANEEAIANHILTDKIRNDISGAGFESAAISAAIDMENKSVEVYEQRSRESMDPNEKELYRFLAEWEKGHHTLLLELNRQLTEKIWYDNNFWPF